MFEIPARQLYQSGGQIVIHQYRNTGTAGRENMISGKEKSYKKYISKTKIAVMYRRRLGTK